MLREVKWLSSESFSIYKTKPGFQWIDAASKASAFSSTSLMVQNVCFLSQWGPLSLFSTGQVANLLSFGFLKREVVNLWVSDLTIVEKQTVLISLQNPSFVVKEWLFGQIWGIKIVPNIQLKMKPSLSMTMPYNHFFFSLFIFVNILFLKHLLLSAAPVSRFPFWGPGFIKGQADVHSASGLFNARGALRSSERAKGDWPSAEVWLNLS